MILDILTVFANCVFLKEGFWFNCLVEDLYPISERVDNESGKFEYSILSAFEHSDKILVTAVVNRESKNHPIYCRYYDSDRTEIPESEYSSFFSSSATVSCPKRHGSVYVSLSEKSKDVKVLSELVKLVDRTGSNYDAHNVGACVGLTNEDQLRILESFLDDHVDVGVKFFYIFITKELEENANFKTIIEDYQERSLVEISSIEQTNLSNHDILQLYNCYFRSRSHSKWVVNLTLKDRLKIEQLSKYLKSLSENVGELKFSEGKNSNEKRSKTMFQPEKTEEPDLFVKKTWKLKPTFFEQNVPTDIGYLTKVQEREY